MSRLSHVLYNSSFGFLSFVFLLLTLVSPGDLIYQSYSNHRLGNIFVVAGVYIVTFLLTVLTYACRILTNRSVLAGIPKPWIPIEKPDVAQSVRKQIVAGLTRSAIIAQQSRPRDCRYEDIGALDPELTLAGNAPHGGKDGEKLAPWGAIQHPGWTAPDCADLPSCNFEDVIAELPFLVEAKAVSLAPPDPEYDQSQGHRQQSIVPDARVVEVLRRQKGMCLRAYLDYLTGLGVVKRGMAHPFVRLYERAKFAANPLTENEFRTLMHLFSALLHDMAPLWSTVLADIRANLFTDDESDEEYEDIHSYLGYYSNPSGSFLSADDASGRSDASIIHRPRLRVQSISSGYLSMYSVSDDSRLSIKTTSTISRKRPSQRVREFRRRMTRPLPADSIFRVRTNRAKTMPTDTDLHPPRLPSSLHLLAPPTPTPRGRRRNSFPNTAAGATTTNTTGPRYSSTLHPDTAANASFRSLHRIQTGSSYQSALSNSGSSTGSVVRRPTTGSSLSLRTPPSPGARNVALGVLDRIEAYASSIGEGKDDRYNG
ncbi:hypothetical protein KEM56_002173 [Ascosphaera pollenicola]|nr:hypothetical protein KEM56_002173 [Ascosphaera pollenicola]